jgi:hypothetical protein
LQPPFGGDPDESGGAYEGVLTEFFTAGGQVRFRSRVIERDVVVLDRGTAVLPD